MERILKQEWLTAASMDQLHFKRSWGNSFLSHPVNANLIYTMDYQMDIYALCINI